MNPAPQQRPVNPAPWLTDRRIRPADDTPVVVSRGLPLERISQIERDWSTARASLATTLAAAGFHLDNAHWDWRNKVRHYPPGWHCLVAVEVENEIQGLMAVETKLRPSYLNPSDWVVYVDFIEAAPWNLREPADRRVPAIQLPRFSGVGALLLAEAVRMSMGRTANGRVGLHSLSSAEDFYSVRCGMTSLGPDPSYHDLVYFEYPDSVAARWLTTVGFSA